MPVASAAPPCDPLRHYLGGFGTASRAPAEPHAGAVVVGFRSCNLLVAVVARVWLNFVWCGGYAQSPGAQLSAMRSRALRPSCYLLFVSVVFFVFTTPGKWSQVPVHVIPARVSVPAWSAGFLGFVTVLGFGWCFARLVERCCAGSRVGVC